MIVLTKLKLVQWFHIAKAPGGRNTSSRGSSAEIDLGSLCKPAELEKSRFNIEFGEKDLRSANTMSVPRFWKFVHRFVTETFSFSPPCESAEAGH